MGIRQLHLCCILLVKGEPQGQPRFKARYGYRSVYWGPSLETSYHSANNRLGPLTTDNFVIGHVSKWAFLTALSKCMRYRSERNRQNPFCQGFYVLMGETKSLKSKHITQFQQMRDVKKIKQKAMESEEGLFYTGR